MFGDVGHGFLMLLFGLYMIAYERQFLANKSSNEVLPPDFYVSIQSRFSSRRL